MDVSSTLWVFNSTTGSWVKMEAIAAALTQDETAVRFIPTASALYGFDGTDLRRLLVESTTNPNLRMALYSSATAIDTSGTNVDGLSGAVTVYIVKSFEHLFNGTTWDRSRNNVEVTVLASAARTSTTNSADLVNYNARGVRIFLDITAASGTTPTLDLKVQSKDALSAAYVDDPGSTLAQKTGVSTDELTIYPGVTTSANRARSAPLPRTWRVVCTIGGTTPSFTFSVGASYIN